MTLGQKIVSIRKKRAMSQHELSKRCGVTQATLSRAERNLIRQLKSDAIRRIAEALGCTSDFLIGKTDLMDAKEVLRSDPKIGEFIELYSGLDDNDREHLNNYMKYIFGISQYGGTG